MRSASFLTLILSTVLLTTTTLADDGFIRLTALNAMERILQHEAPFGKPSAEIAAARNEVESFQVVVAAQGENLQVTSVRLPELVGPGGVKITGDCIRLYREEYVRVRLSTPLADLPPGLYPDPLIPFIDSDTGKSIQPRSLKRESPGTPLIHDAVPFKVFAGQNQPLWIDIHVPKDAPAGIYRGTVQVSSNKGKAELPVALTVWDFNLPDGPTHCNHFGTFSRIGSFFNVDKNSDEFRAIESRYCQAMAEHRLNPPLPSHLLPQINRDGSLNIDPQRHAALRAFIEKWHVTDFQIPSSPFGRNLPSDLREKTLRYYRSYHQYVTTNGWGDRAYVYLIDEPNTAVRYEQVRFLGEAVHEAEPALKCLVVEQTYSHDPTWPDIDPAVDIWCPLWSYIDRESIKQKIQQGDAVWSYTALVQRTPTYYPSFEEKMREKDPPYWHIDRPLLVYRVPTWINRQYGITGLLYWSTVTGGIDPWYNPAISFRGNTTHYNGGGSLFYPGLPCGIQGPIASMRLKNLRDGMEDYEYFALLAQRGGAAAVQKIVDRIAPNWWEYTRDPQALYDARQEMAAAILARK